MDVSVIYTWRIYFLSAIDGFKTKNEFLRKIPFCSPQFRLPKLSPGWPKKPPGDLKFTVGGNLMNGIF